jgi:7,8-dihydropterin-6-yl-methyl-4-(beta-D-ribofuranosyl)aminobenzene 5'-phosphate synthase
MHPVRTPFWPLFASLGLLFGLSLVNACSAFAEPAAAGSDKAPRITILYDAFGKTSTMKKDWGFSAYIEYGGKKILFDTGNNADIFAHNVQAKGIDLTKLDFAIVSHRHGDHTSGLSYLLKVNPKVKIYAPQENFGVFGAALPGTFYRRDEALPTEMRYFDGNPPAQLRFGSPWPNANFVWIKEDTEIAPGFHIIALTGNWGTDFALREISLAMDTPKGVVLVVGCSHTTIEKIVQEAKATLNKPIHLVFGGLHLLPAKDDQIKAIAASLHDANVEFIAPAHCTGERAFAIFKESFGDKYVYTGLGSTTVGGEKVTVKADAGERVKYAMDAEDYRSYREAMAGGPYRALLGGRNRPAAAVK